MIKVMLMLLKIKPSSRSTKELKTAKDEDDQGFKLCDSVNAFIIEGWLHMIKNDN